MKISKEVKKAEALRRMKQLQIYEGTIEQFKKDGCVSASEYPFGAYYWVDDDEVKHIKEIEDKYDILIYTGILTRTEFGTLISYLYVSDNKSEWKEDSEMLKQGEAYSYVHNLDGFGSEFGCIGFKMGRGGGLLRTF